MEDIHKVLANHRPRKRSEISLIEPEKMEPTYSAIPDVFFDDVLPQLKLGRIEVTVLMGLYRHVWCRPNLYQKFGISTLLSLKDFAKNLNMEIVELQNAIRKLEETQLIETIRAGQYFVRKFFLKNLDEKFGQSYDDFEI
jgi:hypothetical protein